MTHTLTRATFMARLLAAAQADPRIAGVLDYGSTSEERGDDGKIWGSMIKQALKRKQPGFSERYHGFRSFRALLEAARDRGLVELKLDEKSGDYSVKSVAEQGA